MSTQPQLSPLEQLEQSSPPPAASSSSSGLSPLEQLEQSAETTQAPPSGQTTLLGETVGAPSPGPSPAGRLGGLPGVHPHTPSIAEGVGDVALAASPLAAGALPGEAVGGAEKILQLSETALEHLAENYPQLTKLATKLGYGVGAAGAYKLLNKLGIH